MTRKGLRHIAAMLFGVLGVAGCYEHLPIDPHGFACATSDQCGGALACVRGRCDDPNRAELTFPVRAAFYHLDYPFNWATADGGIAAHETPVLGRYSGIQVLDTHLKDFEYGKLDVALTYWWGNGSPTDSALSKFMPAAEHSNVRWAVVFMREDADHPAGTDLVRLLADVRVKFTNVPNYFRLGGKPVLYVMSDPAAPTCELADRWVTANHDKEAGIYLVLRPSSGMAGGFAACASQPDAWVDFDATEPELARGDSFSVSPGAWAWNQPTPALARDPARFAGSVAKMAASSAKFQIVTSFNAWDDGTAVEPAQEWTSASGFGTYLDLLHGDGGAP